MLVIYEASGMNGEIASYLMRSLLSEGRIDYVTVVKTKNGLESQRITREGPTGLITTTTAVSLHPENETRLLSLTVTDSPAQTKAVMLAYALGPAPERDRSAWHELQDWLAENLTEVVVPYLSTLADSIPPVSVRLRRDFPTLITLIRAHALLEQLHRERDQNGAVVASIEDYAVVRGLVADLFADAAERSVSATVRDTVAAVGELAKHDLLGDGVPATAVASILGLDKATAWRRAKVAISRGFIRNLEPRPNRPGRLVPGELLPEDSVLLPTAAELERLHGCFRSRGDSPIELEYPDSALDPDADAAEPMADSEPLRPRQSR